MSDRGEHSHPFLGQRVIDEHGEAIGSVEDVLFDSETGEPRWAVVKPGLLHRAHYVPLRGAYQDIDGDVVVAHSRRIVLHAPVPSSEHVLSDEDEQALRDHYG